MADAATSGSGKLAHETEKALSSRSRLPSIALRRAAAMREAVKGFRRLRAKGHLPALRATLANRDQQLP